MWWVSLDLRAEGQKQPHIWNPNSDLPVHLSLYNFLGASMTIKGYLQTGVFTADVSFFVTLKISDP